MADGDKTAATAPQSPGAAQLLELPIEQELQE